MNHICVVVLLSPIANSLMAATVTFILHGHTFQPVNDTNTAPGNTIR